MKIIHNLFLVFIIAGYGNLEAQKHTSLLLDKDCRLLGSAYNDKGLALLTGKEFALKINPNWKISYYTPDLRLRFQVNIPHPALTSDNDIIISASGNNLYFMQDVADGSNRSFSERQITRIDSNGKSYVFTLGNHLNFERLNVVFADDRFLYFVTKEKEGHGKFATTKIRLICVDHTNAVTNLLPSLPPIEESATEWSYLTHTPDVIYFISRSTKDRKNQKYKIAVVDYSGKLQDHFSMPVNIKEGVFVAGHNLCTTPGILMADDNSYTMEKNASSRTNNSRNVYVPNLEAYGNLKFDPISNGFYVFGFSGSIPQKDKDIMEALGQVEPSEFYLIKFNQDGRQDWAYEGPMKGIDDHFKHKPSFFDQYLDLNYGFGGNIVFQAYSDKMLYTFEIDPQTGKLVTGYTNTFKNFVSPLDLCSSIKSGSGTEMENNLPKPENDHYSLLSFRIADKNIVVRNYYKNYKIDLYEIPD